VHERGQQRGAHSGEFCARKIQEESMYCEHRKHDGTYPIIGINTFRKPHADTAPPQKIESLGGREARTHVLDFRASRACQSTFGAMAVHRRFHRQHG